MPPTPPTPHHPPNPTPTFTTPPIPPLQPHRPPRPNTTPKTPTATLATLPRRQFATLLAAVAFSLPLPPSSTQALTLANKEADPMYGYSFHVPSSGWTRSTAGLSSFRQAIIYLCDDDADSNISVVTTPVPGDFQKLTSFGGLDNVIATLIPKEGKDISGQVIHSRLDSRNNSYVIEYTISSRGIDRHLLTVFALQPGKYLVTLTGQARENNWTSREDVLRAVTESFHLDIFP